MSAKVRRRIRKIVISLVGLYAAALVVVFGTHLPDRLIIHAAPGALDCPGGRSALMTSPTGRIEVCIADSPAPEGAEVKGPGLYVLFFVGNEDRVNPWAAGVAKMWEENTGLAVEAWGVNLPGFGLSTGPAYLSRVGPAALAAYDHLKARAGGKPIAVQAASLGTLAALCISANREVAAMTIQDPPPLSALVLERNSWWNGYLLSAPIALYLPGNIDSVRNAGRSKAPCVFITSACDTVIPPAFQARIIDAYGGPKRREILAGARHCGRPDTAASLALGELRRWMIGQMKATKPARPLHGAG